MMRRSIGTSSRSEPIAVTASSSCRTRAAPANPPVGAASVGGTAAMVGPAREASRVRERAEGPYRPWRAPSYVGHVGQRRLDERQDAMLTTAPTHQGAEELQPTSDDLHRDDVAVAADDHPLVRVRRKT